MLTAAPVYLRVMHWDNLGLIIAHMKLPCHMQNDAWGNNGKLYLSFSEWIRSQIHHEYGK